jgi:hypothetical protein
MMRVTPKNRSITNNDGGKNEVGRLMMEVTPKSGSTTNNGGGNNEVI